MISSGRLEKHGNIVSKDRQSEGQKWQIPSRRQRDQEEMERINEELYKKISMNQINSIMWSTTQRYMFWRVKSRGLQVVLLLIKLVDEMKFLQNYSKTLKGNAIKVLHSICQQVWKTQQWPLEKLNPHPNLQEAQY